MAVAGDPSLIAHLERYLGEIEAGWTVNAKGHHAPFQVARFSGGSGPTTVAFSTLGLSRHVLHSWTTGKEVRHELMMIVPRTEQEAPVPSLLEQVGVEALANQHAYLRGQVIGPRGQLLDSPMEALYVASPVYFPDEFATCDIGGQTIVIVWLVPISQEEAAYVHEHGWEAFEDRLVELDPNLTDLTRPSMTL